jgi:hypothetical protein
MKDFNGNTLVLGDIVAFLEPNYRHMTQGRVVGFTPKQIRIEFTPFYARSGTRYEGKIETALREHNYVAKIQQKEPAKIVEM